MRVTIQNAVPTPRKLWLAKGDETGAIYLMTGPDCGICLIAKGGMAVGEFARSGGFTALPRGTVVTIEVD